MIGEYAPLAERPRHEEEENAEPGGGGDGRDLSATREAELRERGDHAGGDEIDWAVRSACLWSVTDATAPSPPDPVAPRSKCI